MVELMISITIAMILSIGMLLFYTNQVRTFTQVARKEHTTQESLSAFEVIAGLLRQAEMCLVCPTPQTISIAYPIGVANPNAVGTLQQTNDSTQLDFTTPSGYEIWPNNVSPYTNNAIRIIWDNSNNQVSISAGASITDAANLRAPIILAGAPGNQNTKIINLDLWPMAVDAAGVVTATPNVTDKATAGFRLSMTARVGVADTTYINPLDSAGSLKNYRTVTYERNILPRNW